MNRNRGRKSNVTTELTQPSPRMPQLNGQECFFTEATFRRVMGPELSFEQKILSQIRRIAEEKAKKQKGKKKPIDLDKPNELDTEQDAPIQRETILHSRDRTLQARDSTFDLLPDQCLELSMCTRLNEKKASRREAGTNKITSKAERSDCLKSNESGCDDSKSMVVIDVAVSSENVVQACTKSTTIVPGLAEAADAKIFDDSNDLDLVQQSSPPVLLELNTKMSLNPGNDFILPFQNIDFTPNTITSPAPEEKIQSEGSHLNKEEVLCLVMPSLSDEDDELEVDTVLKANLSVSSPVSCSTESSLACVKTSVMNSGVALSSKENAEVRLSSKENAEVRLSSKENAEVRLSSKENAEVWLSSKENAETTVPLRETNVGIALTTENTIKNNQAFPQICQDSQVNQYTPWDSGQCNQSTPWDSGQCNQSTPWDSGQCNQSTPWDSGQCMEGSVIQQSAWQLPHVSCNQVVETPKWSEEDIPIFSVKADEQNAPATSTSNSGKINVCPPEAKKAKTDKATQENVGKAPAFKQSDLTREEHAQYLKLYKKYLGAFSQGGLPSVLGSQQMKELAVFEKLQKRVLREQAEFQDYLKKNAERNPKFYQFLREPARNYSTSRIGAYRLKKGYANLYSSSLCDKISLSPGSGCTQMTHQQTLLEVGVPPLINLPSMPKGKPPTKIPHNMKKIDALFPKFTKKKPHGFIHHDPVSFDVNAKVLVVKHSIQVVMSSSVVGCLFNNQEPNYNHVWNIPVTVEECRSNGKVSKVVYLDKPLFEDDLRVRDYNAIFHKYALRAFVSRVRRQHKRAVTIQGFERAQHQGVSDPVDDPFDMFNSSVTNLETFGTSGTSAKKSPRDKTLSAGRTLKNQSREAVKELNPSNVNPLSPTIAGGSTQPAKSPAQKSLIDRMDMTKGRSRLLMKEDLSSSSSDMAISLEGGSVLKVSPRIRKQAKLLQTNTSPGSNYKSLHGLRAENDTTIAEAPIDTTITEAPIDATITEAANVLSPTQGDRKFLNRTRGRTRKCVAESVQPHCENVHSEDVTESNKNESSSLGSHDAANITAALLDMSGPLSPAASPPSSPQPDTSDSVNQVIREIPSSPVLDGPHEIPPVRIIPLSPSMSAVGSSAKDQPQGRGYTSSNWKNNPTKDSHSAVELISRLGSGLAQTFEGNLSSDKTLVPKEDPTDFVQPLEDCSSLHYNLWSLGDKKVLIRSSCHGIIKDHKKPRAIYLFPKLEYQPTHGLEQVTVNEMVKNWTSCYIRQNTNLLRARINAFTSEILMYEEMEPHKILQPSLNFKPHNAFQFLDNVLNHLIRLECGKYLLSHDAGSDYCGVKQMSGVSDYQTQRPHNSSRKRRAVDETIPWIPIDPTLLLPLHEEKNRIPATFMPKDCVLENPGKKKNDFGHGNNKRNKKPQEKKKKKNKTS